MSYVNHDIETQCNSIEIELSKRFLPHKNRDVTLSNIYGSLGYYKRSDRVFFCGTQLDFRIPEDLSESPKLYRANFCKDRLCSMCAWRRSLKVFGQVSQVMDKLQEDYLFVFVTLTLRNCAADELQDTVGKLQEAYKLFMLYKEPKQAFKGYFKSLEITRHPEHPKEIEYHPHLHCIFAVNKRYFKGKDYISYEKLRALWKQALGIDYDPQVDIRKVKENVTDEEGDTLGKAVAEVAKYAVKSDDYLQGSEEEMALGVRTFLDAISHRRLCSFGGIFKKVARELALDDMTDGDLVLTNGEKLRKDIGYLIVKYQWQIGYGYYRRLITYEKEE